MINHTQDFRDAILSPIVEPYIKLELMDRYENVLDEYSQKIDSNSVGDISVDGDRDIRRTFTFGLDNNNGEFTWNKNKLIWMDNKRIKVYIGLRTPAGIEYVPQGVFVITQPESRHRPQENTVSISGQDKWYLLTGNFGRFDHETTIPKGTNIKNAIKIIAENAGITKMILDDTDITFPYDLTYQIGQNRGEAIKELCSKAYSDNEFFYEVFFDVNGYLRFQKFKDPKLESPVWTYKIEEGTLYSGSSRKLQDTEMFNHIIVMGGSSQTAEFRTDIIIDETNPQWANHPFSIQKIGDRLFCWNNGNPDSNIDTQSQCDARARFELNKRLNYSEAVDLNLQPNYLHDVDDVVEIIDDANGCLGYYQLKKFTVPIKPKIVTASAIKVVGGLV